MADNDISVAISIGQSKSLALTHKDDLVISDYDGILVNLGHFTKKRADDLCEYIQRLAIHVK